MPPRVRVFWVGLPSRSGYDSRATFPLPLTRFLFLPFSVSVSLYLHLCYSHSHAVLSHFILSLSLSLEFHSVPVIPSSFLSLNFLPSTHLPFSLSLVFNSAYPLFILSRSKLSPSTHLPFFPPSLVFFIILCNYPLSPVSTRFPAFSLYPFSPSPWSLLVFLLSLSTHSHPLSSVIYPHLFRSLYPLSLFLFSPAISPAGSRHPFCGVARFALDHFWTLTARPSWWAPLDSGYSPVLLPLPAHSGTLPRPSSFGHSWRERERDSCTRRAPEVFSESRCWLYQREERDREIERESFSFWLQFKKFRRVYLWRDTKLTWCRPIQGTDS